MILCEETSAVSQERVDELGRFSAASDAIIFV